MLIYEILEKCINRYEKCGMRTMRRLFIWRILSARLVKNVWITYIIPNMPLKMPPKENMIAFIWLIFIPASTLVGIHQS